MQITLYKFSKRNNSTKRPSDGTTVSCVLKEDTSVLSPAFRLHMNTLDYNYCKWDNRYYYINDVISMANNYTEIRCSVDALASWKDYIGSSSEYVLRSASANDGYIPDMLYPIKAKPTVRELSADTMHTNFILTGGMYVVGVVNDDNNSSGAITYYGMLAADFRTFLHFMFNTPSYMGISSTEISDSLTKALVDPFQYIKSCVWYPCSVTGSINATVKFGWWTYNASPALQCLVIGESDRIITASETLVIPQHPQAAARGKYLNGSPFRRMTGYCYNFGKFVIDPTYWIEGGNLLLRMNIDVFSNVGVLRIYDASGNITNQMYSSIGVDIPIAQLSVNPIQPLLSAAGGIGSLATGNVLGYANGLFSAIDAMIPQSQSSGSNGTKVAYNQIPKIIIEDYLAANDSNIHNGRPLCQERTIGSLSGYMVIDNPDVNIPCTSTEKDTITAALAGGFYYE